MPADTLPGRSYPIGATVYPDGVNFCVFSRNCTALELLLFDDVDVTRPSPRHPARSAAQQDLLLLAHLRAGPARRTAVWLSRLRAVSTARRLSLRSRQSAARSLRARRDGRAITTIATQPRGPATTARTP